jgi:hypothetical protein
MIFNPRTNFSSLQCDDTNRQTRYSQINVYTAFALPFSFREPLLKPTSHKNPDARTLLLECKEEVSTSSADPSYRATSCVDDPGQHRLLLPHSSPHSSKHLFESDLRLFVLLPCLLKGFLGPQPLVFCLEPCPWLLPALSSSSQLLYSGSAISGEVSKQNSGWIVEL